MVVGNGPSNAVPQGANPNPAGVGIWGDSVQDSAEGTGKSVPRHRENGKHVIDVDSCIQFRD